MKTICFLADAGSPHTRKWIAGCSGLNCRIVVISHHPGEIPGAEVIVQPLSLVAFPRECLKVRRMIRRLRPALVHAHQFGAHGLYAWFSGVRPLVISAWGSDVLVKPKESHFLARLVAFLARKADRITVDSPDVREILLRMGARPSGIMMIPFGIVRTVFERLRGTVRPADRFIICSPRLHEPIYNLPPILKAFQRIEAEFPQAELWFLGSGSLSETLTQQAKDLGLQRVHFWGRVSPAEFSERIARSDVVVSIPSSDGTPVTLLEAMAAGSLPVLSDLPAYHDWVAHEKTALFTAPDAESLVATLRRSIIDATLREEAAQLNRETIAARAVWEEQFRPMVEYYEAVLGEKER